MALAPPLVRAKQRIEAAKAIVILRMPSTQLLFEATKDKRVKPKIGSSSARIGRGHAQTNIVLLRLRGTLGDGGSSRAGRWPKVRMSYRGRHRRLDES
jgi:hypothetical protein